MDCKKILIIGGTGTLGTALISRIYANEDIKIKVISRDEHKQQKLKKIYPKIEFSLADIRDKESLKKHFKDIDVVFHFAALKHIDLLEKNPIECIKTNILGTINVCETAIENNVKYMVFSSTDKAVDPINVYGLCKAISERLVLNYNQEKKTIFTVFRWGNIINSNGSALPFFIEKIKKDEEIPLTHVNMTRFFITIEDAVEFVLDNFHIKSDEVYVHPNMKAAKIIDVIKVIASSLGKGYHCKLVGLRPGEKIDECLHSKYSGKFMDSKICPQYTEEELRELLRPML